MLFKLCRPRQPGRCFSSVVERLESRALLNAVTQENALPGAPPSAWYIDPEKADPAIQGFATDISVDRGQTISFKINDTASSPAYHIEIYRMGYYQGLGARLVATIEPSATQCIVRHQPDPITDSKTGLSDCGNWSVSATWNVPANATSGIYFANIVRNDGGGKSRMPFVVRDDASHSALLFQTSDATWQAYNSYGTPETPLQGRSLYDNIGQAHRAFAVSYNRPLVEGDYTAATINSFFFAEYPMVRFLERNGYDVSYFTDVDSDRLGSLIRNHKVFLSVGHDEYWSGRQLANVRTARNAGVNLAFFSGNEAFWKTRYQDSIDASNTPDRTLVCYKEPSGGAIDPDNPKSSTSMWRDPRYAPPFGDAGVPENALKGGLYAANWYDTGKQKGWNAAITIPAADAHLRFWRNTAVAHLQPGQTYTTPAGYLGYEWDQDADNGFRPPGLIDLSSTTIDVPAPGGLSGGGGTMVDNYGWLDKAYATHNLTLFRAASGALVFDAGTVQWSWALNSDQWGGGRNFHWYQFQGSVQPPVPVDPNLQQATVNLLADMGAQPGSLQAGLATAVASADHHAPVSRIVSPAAGVCRPGVVVVSGTATDVGGVVAGVEVSTDDGASWHPASGTSSWTYTWIPETSGTFRVESRAVDDSGILESVASSVLVTVHATPLSIWSGRVQPAVYVDPGIPARHAGVELGLRFSSDVAGFVTGVRFWKVPGNSGMHSGELWDAAGNVLDTATFSAESSQGWQQVLFYRPVFIAAHTTYVVSYHTAGPTIAHNSIGVAPAVDSPFLHPLGGVYRYDLPGQTRFPSQPSALPQNYWVDVVFQAAAANGPAHVPANHHR